MSSKVRPDGKVPRDGNLPQISRIRISLFKVMHARFLHDAYAHQLGATTGLKHWPLLDRLSDWDFRCPFACSAGGGSSCRLRVHGLSHA